MCLTFLLSKHNLLSVGKLLDQHQLYASFEQDSCSFQDLLIKEVKVVGTTFYSLYKTSTPSKFVCFSSDATVVNKPVVNNTLTYVVKLTIELVHARLGHPYVTKLKHVIFPLIGNNNCDFSYEACVLGKHHKLPFSSSHSIASSPFDLVYIDIWGPYKRPFIFGATYFLTMLDDNTRTTWTYLLHTKTQVPSLVSDFCAYVENHFGKHIKTIRSDNGTEIIQDSYA